MVRGAFGDMDCLSFERDDCNKQTIDIHCPRFSESPTNISLLPLNFSHISVTLHLRKVSHSISYYSMKIQYNYHFNPHIILICQYSQKMRGLSQQGELERDTPYIYLFKLQP